MAFKDLTGQKFGKLTVIERAENKGRKAAWKCRCECGNICVVAASQLKRKGAKATKSCGCLQKENRIKHGLVNSRTYRIWAGAKDRCNNPHSTSYRRYGGRGITMASEFANSFQTFYDYVSKLPHFGEEGYTLDRIDNNKGYERGNLRWANRKTQQNNLRSNHIIEYNGEKMTVAEAAEKSGLVYGTLSNRVRRGSKKDKFFAPVQKHKDIIVDYQDAQMCLAEASRKSGINYGTLQSRYRNGDTGERLFRPVKRR